MCLKAQSQSIYGYFPLQWMCIRDSYLGARRVSSSQFAAIYEVVGQAALKTVGMPYAAGQALSLIHIFF